MLSEAVSLLLQIFFILNIIFTILIVFFERKSPVVTWAWIIILNILPYFGFILYLLFGLEARKHKIFILKSKFDNNLYEKYLSMFDEGNYFLEQQNILKN